MWLACNLQQGRGDLRSTLADNTEFFSDLFEVDLIKISLRINSTEEEPEAYLAVAAVTDTANQISVVLVATC
jgi:hypothetical protein